LSSFFWKLEVQHQAAASGEHLILHHNAEKKEEEKPTSVQFIIHSYSN
jgi:hypothetical protein